MLELAVTSVLALKLDGLLHRLEVRFGSVEPGELGHPGLEQTTRLEDPRYLADPELGTLFDEAGRDDVGTDEHAARGADLDRDDPRFGQQLDRFTQGGAADGHLLGERALRRQAVADVQVARPDGVGDLPYRLFEGRARLNRMNIWPDQSTRL